jgi:hypothetical protein
VLPEPIPRRLTLERPGGRKLLIDIWSFCPSTFALTLDMSSDTVVDPLRSMSSRVIT